MNQDNDKDKGFNKLKKYFIDKFPELTELKRKNKMEGKYDGINQPKFTTFYYYDDEVWFIEYDNKDIFSSAKWDVNDKLETFWSLLNDDELFEKLIKDVCDIDLFDKWGKKYNWQFDDMSETLLPRNIRESIRSFLKEKDPKVGTGKKPEGSDRRLYTDENPKDTVSVKFKTKEDIIDTLNKESFKSKPHKRQSQIINLIHQRVRAAYQNAKDPETKKRLKRGYDYIETVKEKSKRKTQEMKEGDDRKIKCDCGWSWKLEDGGNDPYTCHKCGKVNTKEELTEKCWSGYTQKGMKTMFGKRYPNCVKKKKK